MHNELQKIALDWAASAQPSKPGPEHYCETRDIFQSRLDKALKDLLANNSLDESAAYLIAAIVGEIGNNSFDHNIGSWPDVPGIFFAYDVSGQEKIITLADRGQGVKATLIRVKPELKNDSEALATAFNERISGRAPEPRGNGLKFVKKSISEVNLHLAFYSGKAMADINESITINESKVNIQGCLAIIGF